MDVQEVDEFLLLACDGIYDVMDNAELCDFVQSRLRVTDDLSNVANQVRQPHVLDCILWWIRSELFKIWHIKV